MIRTRTIPSSVRSIYPEFACAIMRATWWADQMGLIIYSEIFSDDLGWGNDVFEKTI